LKKIFLIFTLVLLSSLAFSQEPKSLDEMLNYRLRKPGTYKVYQVDFWIVKTTKDDRSIIGQGLINNSDSNGNFNQKYYLCISKNMISFLGGGIPLHFPVKGLRKKNGVVYYKLDHENYIEMIEKNGTFMIKKEADFTYHIFSGNTFLKNYVKK
jgi:hypothetical protein